MRNTAPLESIDPRSVGPCAHANPALTTQHPGLWLAVLVVLVLFVGAFQ